MSTIRCLWRIWRIYGGYTAAADPEVAYTSSHTRDKLEEFIGDYNKQYGTAYSTKD